YTSRKLQQRPFAVSRKPSSRQFRLREPVKLLTTDCWSILPTLCTARSVSTESCVIIRRVRIGGCVSRSNRRRAWSHNVIQASLDVLVLTRQVRIGRNDARNDICSF